MDQKTDNRIDQELDFLSPEWFKLVVDEFLVKYLRHVMEKLHEYRQEMQRHCDSWKEGKDGMTIEEYYLAFEKLTELDREIQNCKFVIDKLLVECIERGLDKTLCPLYGIHKIKFIN